MQYGIVFEKENDQYHTGNLDWITPSENQALRACSSFWGILGNTKPFYLQIDCLYKLFKLGLIGVLKCALFAFFHSKSTILMVKNCQNFVIFPTFQSQNDSNINGRLEICWNFFIIARNYKLGFWISEGLVPTVLAALHPKNDVKTGVSVLKKLYLNNALWDGVRISIQL